YGTTNQTNSKTQGAGVHVPIALDNLLFTLVKPLADGIENWTAISRKIDNLQ
ncbi:MAG: hypothetical protein ACI96P_001848, partial [Candidatus Azotimanducaceae bacterium]